MSSLGLSKQGTVTMWKLDQWKVSWGQQV